MRFVYFIVAGLGISLTLAACAEPAGTNGGAGSGGAAGSGGTGGTVGSGGTGGTVGSGGAGGDAGSGGVGGSPVEFCGDGDLLESDDSYAEGGALPLTGSLNGDCTQEICTGPDFYDEFGPFFVAEAGLYTVSATWLGRADLDLIIIDSDCITALAVGDVASDSPPEVIEVMLSADREFYIGIATWNTYGSTISYTISEGAPGGG